MRSTGAACYFDHTVVTVEKSQYENREVGQLAPEWAGEMTYSFAFFLGPGLVRRDAGAATASPLTLLGPPLPVPSTPSTPAAAADRFTPFFFAPSAAPVGGAIEDCDGPGVPSAPAPLLVLFAPLGVLGVDSEALSLAAALRVALGEDVSSWGVVEAGTGVDTLSVSVPRLLTVLSGKMARSLSGETVIVTKPGDFSSFSDFRRSLNGIVAEKGGRKERRREEENRERS